MLQLLKRDFTSSSDDDFTPLEAKQSKMTVCALIADEISFLRTFSFFLSLIGKSKYLNEQRSGFSFTDYKGLIDSSYTTRRARKELWNGKP